MGITAGYHRYYAHKAYTLHPAAEAVIMFFAIMACQGNVLQWAHDHRLHHRYVDTEKDPYNIKRGFWYAHVFWIFEKGRGIDEKVVPDLVKNKFVMFQYKYHNALMMITNAMSFLFVGWITGDYLGSFIFVWWLRLALMHHNTWFVNSLAHSYGSQPFSKKHSAVNNGIFAYFTFGEGYHNFHHTFASDYRNGIKWYHYDPAKWLIWSLAKLGLAKNLNKVDTYTIWEHRLLEEKSVLMTNLQNAYHAKKEEWSQKLEELQQQISLKVAEMRVTLKEYELPHLSKAQKRALKAKIKTLKETLHQDRKAWNNLCANVLSMRVAA